MNLNIALNFKYFLCNIYKIQQLLDNVIVISYNYVTGGCFFG